MSGTTTPRSDATATAIFGSTLALYLATLFPGVGGLVNHGDSAKFQFLGGTLGLSHPPGNPLYLALLQLVARIPVATEALRANAFSAVCMALAVAISAETARRIGGRVAAIATGLSLALGGLTWTFGTEAEVYALAAVFVAAIALCLARAELEKDPRFVGAALALFALGLGNHLSLVMAAPAGLVALARFRRASLAPDRRSIVLVVLALGFTLALYGMLPWVSTHDLAYSEFHYPPTFRGLLDYVSAEQFRGSVALPTLDAAIRERPIAMTTVLARQWFLPLYLIAPLAAPSLVRRVPILALTLLLAMVAWLGFAFVYAIPDADGFYVPVFVVVALGVGVAVGSARRQLLALVVVTALLVPTSILRFREARAAVPFDVLEDVGYGIDPELLDLPDLVQRIPRGAYLAVPCSHYGCGQVTNYYRFSDGPTRARSIRIITIAGGSPHGTPSPPRAILPDVARDHVVCTIHAQERGLLASRGATMRTIERGTRMIRGVPTNRVPVFCSVP